MIKYKLLLIVSVICCNSVFSQFDDVKAVAEDLIFLTDQYITPAANASVFQASGGWYTSVKPKDKFDVELSIQYNVLLIPNNQKAFLVNEVQLQNIGIQGNVTSSLIPSALGDDNIVVLEGSINDEVFEFDAPEGINTNTVQHGQVQASVGLWKKTNVLVRLAPSIKINSSVYKSLGFGVMHNLNQWFNGIKNSTYNFAFLGTYSNYSVDEDFNEADLIIGKINAIKVDGQSYGFNLISSKTFNNFDVSLGLGLTTSNFEYKVGGEGDLLLDILNTGLETLSKSKTNFKSDLSVNYNLNNFSINSMLTFGNFSNIVVGLNYNFI